MLTLTCNMRRLLLTILMTTAITLGTRAQLLAVSTELTSDAMLAPNIGLELVTANRSSLALHVLYGKRILGKELQLLAVQPENRYWFSGRPLTSWFVGLGGIAAVYDLQIRGKVYDGLGAGIGLTFGYVLPLTRRLSIDFHSGLGAFFYRQKEYYATDNYDVDYTDKGFQRTNASGYHLLPTRIGISLTYILK